MLAAYGSWSSPLTADTILASSIGLVAVVLDGDNIYWLEARPQEKGRNVLVRYAGGRTEDITPAPFNVRTRVHEYGGGAFVIDQGTIYFSNDADGRIYIQSPGQFPQPLTPSGPQRYADLVLDSQRRRIMAVCEKPALAGAEPDNLLVSLDLKTGRVITLAQGSDFYAAPRLSPDGQYLAWFSWEHPHMPWDSSQLWLAEISDNGDLVNSRCLAGQDLLESIHEPKWGPDGNLYFASDRSGWWNLYRYHRGEVQALYPMAAEFAYPHWVFGLSTYTFVDADTILCTYSQDGYWHLALLDQRHRLLTALQTTDSNFASLDCNSQTLVCIASSPTTPARVMAYDLSSQVWQVLKHSSDMVLAPAYLSIPQTIRFATGDNQIAYAWYYPPQNQDYQAPAGERPPLLVKSHGGPTAQASNALNLRVQYWTSRGFAYLDVNYGGSTGYGRAYRQRLEGQWGRVDVEDCVSAAQYLVAQGWVDGQKLAISGSSAGGYTTLAALTFHNTFKAGASYYGVSDLEALAQDTHKFESRYLDRLVGPYPQAIDRYRQRSPIYALDRLHCPVIFFQGLEDQIVPPNQAEAMVAALREKGIPVAYVPFAEEQHGFRSAANIKRALEGEFYFYSRIFGFTPAETLAPVEIVNLEQAVEPTDGPFSYTRSRPDALRPRPEPEYVNGDRGENADKGA